jgi:hypothetical protein
MLPQCQGLVVRTRCSNAAKGTRSASHYLLAPVDNPFVDVPIRLDEREVDSPLAGRVAFFLGDSDGTVKPPPANAGGDLFGRGIQALFRNFLAGRQIGNGIAALCDDTTFLQSVRRLTDTVYAAALARHGVDRIVDTSLTNARVIEVIRAVYPEAPIVRTDHDAAALAERWSDPIGASPPVTPHGPALTGPPVFIVGVPRSGTTWLEHMLLAHPAIDGPERETSIFVSLRALRDNVAQPASAGLAALIGPDELIAAMRTFVASLFANYLAHAGSTATRFLEKTPLHAEHLRLIAEVFPDAAIISVHRDGRDVVRSVLEMESATDSVFIAASKWTEVTTTVGEEFPKLPAARDERYEELLRDPVAAVTDILNWLGLPVDDAVREDVRARVDLRVSQYNTTGPVGPGKWRELSARDLRGVYRYAGDRLVEMGYVSADELRRARSAPLYRVEDVARRVRRR